MKCTKCGFEFDEGLFCPECGAKYDEEEAKRIENEALEQEKIRKEEEKKEEEEKKRKEEEEKAQRELELEKVKVEFYSSSIYMAIIAYRFNSCNFSKLHIRLHHLLFTLRSWSRRYLPQRTYHS